MEVVNSMKDPSPKQNLRLFTMASPQAWIRRSKQTVFQNNVELSNVTNFVAPVFEKE